jgi:hypothetical protein
MSLLGIALNSLQRFYDALKEQAFGEADTNEPNQNRAKEEDEEVKGILRSMGYNDDEIDRKFGATEAGNRESQDEGSGNGSNDDSSTSGHPGVNVIKLFSFVTDDKAQ